ncbi:MAG: AsmA family protein [Gallionellaceae bacterium]|nr:AsmA family protein [Gallionellaceae bacterium]
MSPRTKHIIAIFLGFIVLLITLFLLTFDINHLKPWINKRVSEATGRTFAINGDLKLSWEKPGHRATGWRGWIPWAHISAQNIIFGNPDWAQVSSNMIEVKNLDFVLNPAALLDRKIVLPRIQLTEPHLNLERRPDGNNNWTLKSNSSGTWKFELQRLVVNKGWVNLLDAIKHADVRADIDTLQEQTYGVAWKISGHFNDEPVSGQGRAGDVLSLQEIKMPFPIEAVVQVGKTTIDVRGTLTQPQNLAALDMQLKLSGDSMGNLFPLIGIVLPETPPYTTAGHLTGTLNELGGDWTYEKFSGKVGESDVAGTLEFHAQKPRSLLKGVVVSRLLRLQDLGPVIGADSNDSKANRGAPAVQPADKVLPVEPFKVERWGSIDAAVKFTGQKIVYGKGMPIANLRANIHLQDRVLSLQPLNFGVAGGHLLSTVKLDGRNETINAKIRLSAKHLKLNQMFPAVTEMQASIGEINGQAVLAARGNSVAAMLGSANGEIKATIDTGIISKLLLEKIGLNLGNIILAKIFGDQQVDLNCLAADFATTNGLMTPRIFIVDTDAATLNIGGHVNLTAEQLDLTIKADSKKLRLASLRAPIYLTGSFKLPKVEVDKKALALKAGSAVLLAIEAPLATALLPLTNPGKDKSPDCSHLLTQASKPPPANPPLPPSPPP